jgi:hypothetical protein
MYKLLIFLGFTIETIIDHNEFLDLRIIERENKKEKVKILQKLMCGSWCYTEYWEDTKIIQYNKNS